MQEYSVALGRRHSGLRAISFEAIWRSERPKREAIFSLSLGEGVKKRYRWGALERAAERVVERRIEAVAADGEACDLKRGE